MPIHQQQVHRGFRQASVGATPNGATNTGVVLFAAEPDAANVGAGILPPPVSRGTLASWLTVPTVAGAAATGHTYKFLRKGIWTARFTAQLVAGATGIGMVGISIDCPAAQLLAAGITPTAALTTMTDYDFFLGVATVQATLKTQATINITNAMRGSLPVVANLTPPGTMRLHVGNGAGAVIGASILTVALPLLVVDEIAELFG